jgi:hypothetical protein
MDNIEQKLAELNLGVQDLPAQLQKLIDSVDKQADKLEDEIKAYENGGEQDLDKERGFQDSLGVIESRENYIIDKIQNYAKSIQPNEDEKAPETIIEKTEKKKLGFGTIILGVAVLAITLGAVNVMKGK